MSEETKDTEINVAKENGKKLFTSAYSEDPGAFKTDFENIVRQKIIAKIDARKEEMIADMNKAGWTAPGAETNPE
jgi:hypothetical protein